MADEIVQLKVGITEAAEWRGSWGEMSVRPVIPSTYWLMLYWAVRVDRGLKSPFFSEPGETGAGRRGSPYVGAEDTP